MCFDSIRRCLPLLMATAGFLAYSGVVRAEEKSGEHNLKYEVGIEKDGKEQDKKFDLAKEEEAKELIELLKAGEVEELRKDKPPSFLALRWDLGLWSLVVFLGLMFVLGKVAWKPMLEGLKNREESIRKALEDAEQAKKETAELRQKLQSEMDKANATVRQTIEEGRRDAQRTIDDMMGKAKADIQAERDRLKREIEMARDQAIKELWEQTATLATQISSKAVRRQMNLDDHRRLVDEALTELRQAANDQLRVELTLCRLRLSSRFLLSRKRQTVESP